MTISPEQFSGWSKPPGAHPQQGQLFPLPKPTDEHRWQRGFTPERLAETHAALDVSQSTPRRTQHPFSGQIGRARLFEAVARSDVPLHEISPTASTPSWLRGYPEAESAPERDVTKIKIDAGSTGPAYYTRGSAEGSTAGIVVTKGRGGSLRDLPSAESALMHELGHRHSHMTGRPSSAISSPTDLGQDEAYADDFRSRHVLDRRFPTPVGWNNRYSGYEDPNVWAGYTRALFGPRVGGRVGGMIASRAYREARQTPLQKNAAYAQASKALTARRARGEQQTLYEPLRRQAIAADDVDALRGLSTWLGRG